MEAKKVYVLKTSGDGVIGVYSNLKNVWDVIKTWIDPEHTMFMDWIVKDDDDSPKPCSYKNMKYVKPTYSNICKRFKISNFVELERQDLIFTLIYFI